MNATTDLIPVTPPIPDTGALATISRAELDQQISTARAYPRSIRRFKQDCLDLATLSVAVAKECFYVLPARKSRSGGPSKPIEGPSVRLAEIVLHAWGNVHSAARVMGEDGDFIVAQGAVWDLESNVRRVVEVRRPIKSKHGKYSEDMIAMTANAACAIALRNAAFGVVPRALWQEVYEQARHVVIGDVKTLESRRASALEYFTKAGVQTDRILATLGVEGIEDIGGDALLMLHGIATAIKDGETTVDQAFPPVGEVPQGSRTDQAKALLGKAPEPANLDTETGEIIESELPISDANAVPPKE